MEPPNGAWERESPVRQEFFLWCAALLDRSEALPVHGPHEEGHPLASGLELSPGVYRQVLTGVERARAMTADRKGEDERRQALAKHSTEQSEHLARQEAALADAGEPLARDRVEAIAAGEVEPIEWSTTRRPHRRRAVAVRRRMLAAAGFTLALMLTVAASRLWPSGKPAGTARRVVLVPREPVFTPLPPPPLPPPTSETAGRAQRAADLVHAGEVLAASGKLPEALGLYREGLTLFQSILTRDTHRVDWRRDLAGTWTRVADTLKEQGDAPGALAAYREAEAAEEVCAEARPDDAEIRRDLFFTALNIGDVLLAQNDAPGALEAFRRGAATQQTLCGQDPENAAWQHDLASSFQRVADARDAQGDHAGALAECEDALSILQALAARIPADPDRQHDVFSALAQLGDARTLVGDLPEALQSYTEALTVQKALIPAPGHPDWQRELAETQDKAGQILEARENVAGALPIYRDALAGYERLAAQNADDDALKVGAARTSYHLGRALARVQPADVAASRAALENARAILRDLRSRQGTGFSTELASLLDEVDHLYEQLRNAALLFRRSSADMEVASRCPTTYEIHLPSARPVRSASSRFGPGRGCRRRA